MYKKVMMISLICVIYQVEAMFRRSAPAIKGAAVGAAAGAGIVGVGMGMNVEVADFQDASQTRGPVRKNSAPILRTSQEQFMNAQSLGYDDSGSSIFGQSKKSETLPVLDLETLLYGPKEVSFEEIKGLRFNQLTSDAQRVAYLKNKAKSFQVSPDVNFPLIAHFTNGFTQKQFDLLIKRIGQFAAKDHAQVINMSHIDKAYADVMLHISNLDYFESQGLQNLDEIDEFVKESQIAQNLERMIELYDTGLDEKRGTAYHEAGHAVIFALQHSGRIVEQLSLQSKGYVGAVVYTMPQFKDDVKDIRESGPVLHQVIDESLAYTKNHIQALLAGGVAQSISTGNELKPAEVFLTENTPATAGMGDVGYEGSDLDSAYKLAINYCRWKNNSLALLDHDFVMPTEEDVQREAINLIKQCYYQVDATLRQNKPMLDKIVEIAMRDDYVPGSEIYRIAGRVQPKFEFELTLQEKIARSATRWVAWTLKRIEFYNQQNPQI